MANDQAPAQDTRASTGLPLAETFVYTIYLRAGIETVWNALIDGEFTRKYWGHENRSTWEKGAPWEHVRMYEDGKVILRGRVLEIDPPTKMVWSWAPADEAAQAEKASRVTYDLIALGPDTKLTVTHSELEPDSGMDAGVREGWPAVLSNLKSLLETGEILREEAWPHTA
ncbi:SRPBCC family protein [Paracoccaceae bacterium GXU_MW_L88]